MSAEEEDLDRLKRACQVLAEHFDTVQIFCTRKSESGTINCRWGIGDWFARYGHVKIWSLREENSEIRDVSGKKDWE